MRGPAELPPAHTWLPLVDRAIDEDLGPGDVSSTLVIDAARHGAAVIEAREPLVVCGLDVARAVFTRLDPDVAFERCAAEGEHLRRPGVIARVRGSLRALLAAERSALNFLMRMCGVASQTRRFVEAVAGTDALILDTRKTLPGWRTLDKYATAVGGAHNHRSGLYDGILLKDNHVALAGGVAQAVKSARAGRLDHLRLQVEVESLADALAAVEAGADSLLLDNMSLDAIGTVVERLGERVLLEVSGGVRLENVRRIAETGVHRISIGALTHSAPAADVALEIDLGGGGSPSRGPAAGGSAA
jgi:nicotinate-nucleotide pyrophosphorylase (carboxylating)